MLRKQKSICTDTKLNGWKGKRVKVWVQSRLPGKQNKNRYGSKFVLLRNQKGGIGEFYLFNNIIIVAVFMHLSL